MCQEEKEGESKGWVFSLEGEQPGSYILSTFNSGDFRGGPREGSQQNIHQFSRCVISGSWTPFVTIDRQMEYWGVSLIGQNGGRGDSYTESTKSQKDEWTGPEHAKSQQDNRIGKQPFPLYPYKNGGLQQGGYMVSEMGVYHSPRLCGT